MKARLDRRFRRFCDCSRCGWHLIRLTRLISHVPPMCCLSLCDSIAIVTSHSSRKIRNDTINHEMNPFTAYPDASDGLVELGTSTTKGLTWKSMSQKIALLILQKTKHGSPPSPWNSKRCLRRTSSSSVQSPCTRLNFRVSFDVDLCFPSF